jgi:hypothetical protein
MSELDEPATLTWIEMGEMQPIDPKHSKLDFTRSRDFESVRVAVLFVMEGMTAINRSTAMIHTDERQIAFAEIEVLYNQIKKSRR